MRAALRYTLVSDGPTDDALLPLLNWLLQENGVSVAIEPQFANLSQLPQPPRGLADRIKNALDLFPCDLLFVHRDAEAQPPSLRYEEVNRALDMLRARGLALPPAVCVVPVRMTEAWFLFDEPALRRAAGNPNGTNPLDVPRRAECDRLPDPKARLHEILREASGLSGRRRQKLPTGGAARRVADFIDAFMPLRGIAAFDALEAHIAEVIAKQGWYHSDRKGSTI